MELILIQIIIKTLLSTDLGNGSSENKVALHSLPSGVSLGYSAQFHLIYYFFVNSKNSQLFLYIL